MGKDRKFTYNLPIQACRDDHGQIDITNYMSRKSTVAQQTVNEFKGAQMIESEKVLFYGTACNLLNLAVLFIEFAEGKRDSVDIHNEDIDRHFPELTYADIVERIKSIATIVEEIK